MFRLRACRSVPRGLGIAVAAGVVLGACAAAAQTAAPDPLNPKPDGDPRLSRFQKFRRDNPAPLGPPPRLGTPPASGAGKTGFDSTNARKRKPATKTTAQPIAPGLAAPPSAPASSTLPAAATQSSAQAPAPQPFTPAPIAALPTTPPAKKRKPVTEVDPYDPLGVHAGSFLLFPAVELIGGYDTNPGHVQGGSGASLLRVAPELQAKSDWSAHELKADLRGSYSWYKPDQTPTLSRPDVAARVNGRIDVTRQSRFDLEGRYRLATDYPNSPNVQVGAAKLPIFMSYGGTLGFAHRFNRLEVAVKGGVDRTVFQDTSLVDGTTASNQDRNFNQYSTGLRAGYELLPGVTPFIQADFDRRDHDLNTDFFGFQRNSKGKTGKVGTTFEMTKVLTGEISIGYTVRDYDDARLSQLKGLIGDASLVWTASALTTVKFSAASSVGESVVPGVSGTLYRDVGVQVDHSFRRWLIGTLKGGFGYDDYVGLDRKDQRYYLGAGITYKIDRSIQLKGEFRQEWLRSNVVGPDYSASIFLVGLRLQR